MKITNEHPHVISYKKLIGILIALLILTAITISVSMVDLGKFNVWAALLIASTKCTLVVLFFMHLKYENRVIRISFVVTLFCVAILIGFIFWDISFR